ncbi:hypothetical protein BDV93DRAFT_561629 [Ceratobasidium sp. AG-I]|nr:hypothetical protein BDV93DRAFT_561629 [Ceratobasidium sp. AG-I]
MRFLNNLLDALLLKHKLSKSKPSPASRTVVVYYKTNAPIPVLLGGIRIPLWAVSKAWIEKNSRSFKASQGWIDMGAPDSPNHKPFLERYPPGACNYVDRRSMRAKTEASGPTVSPPHSEPPLRSNSPAPMLQDGNVGLPEGFAQEIPLGLPGPIPQLPAAAPQANAPHIFNPNPLLQGEAGTIVVNPPQLLAPHFQLPPPPPQVVQPMPTPSMQLASNTQPPQPPQLSLQQSHRLPGDPMPPPPPLFPVNPANGVAPNDLAAPNEAKEPRDKGQPVKQTVKPRTVKLKVGRNAGDQDKAAANPETGKKKGKGSKGGSGGGAGKRKRGGVKEQVGEPGDEAE